MSPLADLLWSTVASMVPAATGFGLPGSRTTPDGGVSGDLGTAAVSPTGGEGGGVEIAQQFVFAIPNEVKMVVMLAFAVAIGIYLYINYTRDRP